MLGRKLTHVYYYKQLSDFCQLSHVKRNDDQE
ncbi:hypothetical protein B23_1071 [Geobacillus thermoleovorans B23]|nr:hypothetical protein B23_1071 [Geobacillus thermoleovorans B23]